MDQIGQTILDQLGGNKFRAMTGAVLSYGEFSCIEKGVRCNAFQIHLPRRASNGSKIIFIRLMADDTYTMYFGKLNGCFEYVTLEQVDQLYCDQLQDVFTRYTGLHTRL